MSCTLAMCAGIALCLGFFWGASKGMSLIVRFWIFGSFSGTSSVLALVPKEFVDVDDVRFCIRAAHSYML